MTKQLRDIKSDVQNIKGTIIHLFRQTCSETANVCSSECEKMEVEVRTVPILNKPLNVTTNSWDFSLHT